MIFASDNWAGASDAVMAALTRHNSGMAPAYGGDPLTESISNRFSEIFEREVAVFFLTTGTAANALALSAYAKPGGTIFCHDEAHVLVDECNAPEFFTGGMKLVAVHGPHGKFSPASLKAALDNLPEGVVHHGQPAAVTIAQATEAGTVYSLEEIHAIKEVAQTRGLPLHMDGARFANALVHLDVAPAEMTWRAGVDVLSFGATKNGCWCAEAVVFFNPEDAKDFAYLRKRGGQLLSKSRFAAAQFEGYFEGGNWLDLARHANAMAARLADGIHASRNGRIAWAPQANEVFPIFSHEKFAQLKSAGVVMHEWPSKTLSANETLARMVTSFRTSEDEVEAFLALL
ncbi:low specificity L-threonine aldolase [Rhizobiales bacterium]|uniref:threonine aldolase family protein n=1 Tax=Hongsoonwoonella zoysiae TaxID=2821844 RepID=UPI001560C5E0|nr:low specificity L-threonine aldolase [Hongsoonwoonella zoysiae]NRG17329.1 low specificity L-threonine aldolase [Hongsoonwoonella zoysiae]